MVDSWMERRWRLRKSNRGETQIHDDSHISHTIATHQRSRLTINFWICNDTPSLLISLLCGVPSPFSRFSASIALGVSVGPFALCIRWFLAFCFSFHFLPTAIGWIDESVSGFGSIPIPPLAVTLMAAISHLPIIYQRNHSNHFFSFCDFRCSFFFGLLSASIARDKTSELSQVNCREQWMVLL